MSDFKNWTMADVANHNARVAKENQIPERCPICGGAGEYSNPGSPIVTNCEGCKGSGLKPENQKAGIDRESDLHDQILAEVRRRGWIAFHSRMDKRTTQQPGVPDFIILGSRRSDYTAPEWVPFILLIEVKTRLGKLSPAQFAMQHHAAKLGHTIVVVRDYPQFLALL